MSVIAKFEVESNQAIKTGSNIVLKAVYGKSDPEHENSKFFKYTPNGEIKIGVVSPEVAAEFVPGEEIYVTFSKTR